MRGRAIAASQGKDPDEINKSKNFDSVIIGHVNTIHKPEKADPDLGDQSALGGPQGGLGRSVPVAQLGNSLQVLEQALEAQPI